MNKKEFFNILNKAVFGKGKELMFDVKSTDGKIIRIEGDVLEKGLSVYEILEDGAVAALNDGDYILESGETINVSGGSISDFIPVDVVEEVPAEEAPVDEEVPAEVAEEAPAAEVVAEIVETEVADIAEEIGIDEAVAALAQEIASIKEVVNEMRASAQEMREHIAKFSNIPANDGIKQEKTGFSSVKEESKDSRFRNLEKIKALRSK